MRLEITSAWSVSNARVCAELARQCYEPADPDMPCVPIVSDLAHGRLITCENAQVLAWRGSASIRDWVTDVKAGLDAWVRCRCRIHHGFLEAINSVEYKLLSALPILPRNVQPAPLFVTGHSLGGAMAQLSAWMLRRNGVDVDAVFAFGGPRVGDRAWAQAYNRLGLRDKTWRVVNGEDLVPRLPSRLTGFRHVGHEVFFASLPGLTGPRLDPPVWLKVISDAVGTWHDWRHGRVAQLSDHGMERYLERLGQARTDTD